jgi:hypothetical protein
MEANNIFTSEQKQLIIAEIEKNQPSFFWDYNCELSNKNILSIIDGKIDDVYNEIFDDNIDYLYSLEMECIKNAIGSIITDFDFDMIDDDKLMDEFLDFVSVDMGLKRLVRNTGHVNIRIHLHTSYDGMPSNWSVQYGSGAYQYDDYFKQIIDVLNLNPAKVKKAFLEKGIKVAGAFPNKKNRDGNEYVRYNEFAVEFENNTCFSHLVFVANMDLMDFVNAGDCMPKKITIPKQNYCGLYSACEGGGSVIEMELLKPIVLDLSKHFKTKYDVFSMYADVKGGGYGYTINDAYGVTSHFWGGEAGIEFEKQDVEHTQMSI